MGRRKTGKVEVQKAVNGKKVLLVNRSGNDMFCEGTGRKLPSRGMVVEYNGRYYADWNASSRA